jgi:SAM-dependent methyltransferase
MKHVETSSAKDFFNTISGDYKKKYKPENAFHHYFFNERLAKATKNFILNHKKILDVGAGTGDLYDHVTSNFGETRYVATDVAAGMLENSLIPVENRFLGVIPNIVLPYDDFDNVFMLGVSTYLTKAEMSEHLRFFANNIKPEDGRIAITFTNKYSFDNLFRTLLKPLVKRLKNKETVLSQEILIQKYTLTEVNTMLTNAGFELQKTEWLNHTIFPINLLFKKLSVKVALWIDGFSNNVLLSLFSSDFMVKARLKKRKQG